MQSLALLAAEPGERQRPACWGNRPGLPRRRIPMDTLPHVRPITVTSTMRSGKLLTGGLDDQQSWNPASEKEHPTMRAAIRPSAITMQIPHAQRSAAGPPARADAAARR